VSKNKEKTPERKVRLAKLVCGNTVIAGVLRRGDVMEFTKPMEVVLIPDRSGKTMITLMDFLPASISEVVTMNKDHVICTAEADEKVVALYTQAINPEAVILQPPEKQLLLPPGN